MIGRASGLAAVIVFSLPLSVRGAEAPCSKRIGQLESTFRLLETRPRPLAALPTAAALVPPRAKGRPLVDRNAIIVEYGLKETLVLGRPLSPKSSEVAARMAAADDAIEQHQTNWRLLHPTKKPAARASVAILFDGRVPASEALTAIRHLGERHDVSLLTLEDPDPLPTRVYPVHVAQWLKEIRLISDAAERIEKQSAVLSNALAGCPGAVTGDSAGEDLERREKLLHQQILLALKACSCGKADIEMVEASFLATADTSPLVHVHPVRIRKLEAGSAVTAQDLVARISGKSPAASRASLPKD